MPGSFDKPNSENAIGVGELLVIKSALRAAEERAERGNVPGAYSDTIRRVDALLNDPAKTEQLRKLTSA